MKRIALLAALFCCGPVLAHPGHALPGVAHDLAHALWLVQGGAVLAVALVLRLRAADRRKP